MLTVTRAVPEDVAAMVELLKEMGDFYGETFEESAEVKADQINSVLFANPPLAYVSKDHRRGGVGKILMEHIF